MLSGFCHICPLALTVDKGKGGGGVCDTPSPSVPGWWFKSVYLCPRRRRRRLRLARMTVMHHLRLRGRGSPPAIGRGRGLDFIQWALILSKSLLNSRQGPDFGGVCVCGKGSGGPAEGGGGLTMKSYAENPLFLKTQSVKVGSLFRSSNAVYKWKTHISADSRGWWIFY